MKELRELLQQLKDFEALKSRCELAEEAQARLETVVASLDNIIIGMTLDGAITTWNPGAADKCGYSAKEILGRPVRILVPPDRAHEISWILARIARGKSINPYETLLIRKDGGRIIVFLSISPVMESGGKIKEAVIIARDITKLKDAEEAGARLSAIAESSDMAIISETLDGIIKTWNVGAKSIYGYAAEEVIDRPVSLLIPPSCSQEVSDILLKIARGERVERYETIGMRKDGKLIRISHSVFPVKDAGSRIIGASSITRDITEHKRIEQVFRITNRRLRETLTGVMGAYFALDYQWHFLKINPSAEKLFNRLAEELLGKILWEEYPEAIDTEFYRQYQMAASGRRPVHMEAHFLPTDKWVETHIFPRHSHLDIYLRDISGRKQAEETLRESVQQSRAYIAELQAIYATTPVGLCFLDADLRYICVNDKLAEMDGLPVREHIGRTMREVVPALADFIEPYLRRAIKEGEPVEELEIHGATAGQPGMDRNLLAHIHPVSDETRGIYGLNVALQEITERKKAEETIRFQAFHDPLTGLPNRMLFMDHLNLELGEGRRNRKMLAVMFLDLDNFKNINDRLGHTIGDKLLKEVGDRLKACLRETDTVARIGGDEFTILLTDTAQPEDAIAIAKKITSVFREPFLPEDHELNVTACVGISIYPDDGESADELLKNADIAMYHAKEHGRNNYQFYSAAANVRTLERMLLKNKLKDMINRGELVLHYQPQFNIDSREIICAEALVRWQHPELGLLGPSRFLPIAEELGMIKPIDDWVLRTACAEAKAWQKAGSPAVCVAVNLSEAQFKEPTLVTTISRILQETGLAPEMLKLEITENTVMKSSELTTVNLSRLADIGIGISVDDFGLGYSCVSSLKKLPIQKLKIDKSFIRSLKEDPTDQAVVNAMIAVAHKMNWEVVAKGVETDDQLSFLHLSRCDEMQGYLLSEPLPKEKLVCMLHE